MSSGGGGAKRKKGHEEHEEHVNHERWLVSYADMLTLLFVLFVVLFSMSDVNMPSTMAASIAAAAAGRQLGVRTGFSTGLGGATAAFCANRCWRSGCCGGAGEVQVGRSPVVAGREVEVAAHEDVAQLAILVRVAERLVDRVVEARTHRRGAIGDASDQLGVSPSSQAPSWPLLVRQA